MIVVRKKIEDLLICIATLDELFVTHPRDVEEQRCRRELIQYATILHPFLIGI